MSRKKTSSRNRQTVTGRVRWWLTRLPIVLGCVALLFASLASVAPAGAEEGYDIMRLITSQWIQPNIMLLLDRSNEMLKPMGFNWPVINFTARFPGEGGLQMLRIPFRADFSVVENSAGLFARTSRAQFPAAGIGNGFWIRVHRRVDTSVVKTVQLGNTYGFSTSGQFLTLSDINGAGWPLSWNKWDFIEITDISSWSSLMGLYQLYDINLSTSPPQIRLMKVRPDGIAMDGDLAFFPAVSGTLRKVRIGIEFASDMEQRDTALGLFTQENPGYLYVAKNPGAAWAAGDLFCIDDTLDVADQGCYIITSSPVETTSSWYKFRAAKWDSENTWDVSDTPRTFVTSGKLSFTMRRVILPSIALSHSKWFFVPATRMVVAKNLLGSSLHLREPSSAVVFDPTYDHCRPDLGVCPDPASGAYYDWYYKAWRNWSPGSSTSPGGDPAATKTTAPQRLVNDLSGTVNWGLTVFGSSVCDEYYQRVLVRVAPNSADQSTVVSQIETALGPAELGGVSTQDQPQTYAGLERVRKALLTGYVQAGVTHDGTYSEDNKVDCNRLYGTILVTAGAINSGCGDWTGCPAAPGTGGTYLFEKAEELWNASVSGVSVPVRTWVVGINPTAGRCELNYTAYKGRTDASSPNEDGGYYTEDDPRLPEGSPGTYDSTQDYAFFPDSAAQLKDAFSTLFVGMGAGDYATSAPSITRGVLGFAGFLASTEYPSWEGHLRALDLSRAPDDPEYTIWDAADILRSGGDPNNHNPNNGFARKIYTWNPSSSNALVEVTSGNSALLNSICGSCGFTSQVVDFVRGNDGNGSARPFQLGPIINSTPTVTGPPATWLQYRLDNQSHISFEGDYGARHPLVWVGTSDSMIRAFDALDGAEILALIPPDLLDNQVDLYENYARDPASMPLGQSQLPSEHIYGVANSFRIADVWDTAAGSGGAYRTLMFITEGPGGTGIHAIDVTHPYPGGRTIDGQTQDADPNFGFSSGTDPVKVLWSRTADGEAGTSALSGLGYTWSVPALGAVGTTASAKWRLHVGSGYRNNSSNALTPRVYYLDPLTGNVVSASSAPELTNASNPWVGNQAFADSVVWENDASRFYPDNLVNEGVHVDTNGHFYLLDADASNVTKTTILTLASKDPLYYSPAVASHPDDSPIYALYAFSSGTFFEKDRDITGPNVGNSGYFVPQLHIAVRELATASSFTRRKAIDIHALTNPETTPPTLLLKGTQAIASPLVFTPKGGIIADPFALFLVYEPPSATTAQCAGTSYVVHVTFDPSDLTPLDTNLAQEAIVSSVGQGTAGGFAVAGSSVYVSQSAVGQGAKARLVRAPGADIPIAGESSGVKWYREIQ